MNGESEKLVVTLLVMRAFSGLPGMSMDCAAFRDPTDFSRVVVRAIERSIEILGETARRVSKSYQKKHPEILWREIIGQRNILAHEYGRIDHELLYKTATEDIPELIVVIEKLLAPLDES